MQLEQSTQDAVDQVGQLLIRAAAVIGTLTKEQQGDLRVASEGALPDSLVFVLDAVSRHSLKTTESLDRHPPIGLDIAIKYGNRGG